MKEIIKKLNNKKIAFLGLGIEHISLLKYLRAINFKGEITICDAKKKSEIIELYEEMEMYSPNWCLGSDYDKNLDKYDIIFRVPGYPLFSEPLKKAKESGTEISSPTKLFFEFSPSQNIIGVTGTKGKGTTSGLIFEILKLAQDRVFWGGNIGIPLFDFFAELNKESWIVLELSSFQLEDLETSPKYAVITNLGRDHLAAGDPTNPNFHKSVDAYCQAKFNIIKYQKKNDYAIINNRTKESCFPKQRGGLDLGKGKKIYFTKSEIKSHLVGEFNKENIAAAVEAANAMGIKEGLIRKAVKKFRGLPHRLERVDTVNNIEYYDDSFATTPDTATLALNSISRPIILLAGGVDKGSDFDEFTKVIKEKVKHLVVFEGKGTDRILDGLKQKKYPEKQIFIAGSMRAAMAEVARVVSEGDVVLLSPACASFGIFKNYKERGDLFKAEVKKL